MDGLVLESGFQDLDFLEVLWGLVEEAEVVIEALAKIAPIALVILIIDFDNNFIGNFDFFFGKDLAEDEVFGI